MNTIIWAAVLFAAAFVAGVVAWCLIYDGARRERAALRAEHERWLDAYRRES